MHAKTEGQSSHIGYSSPEAVLEALRTIGIDTIHLIRFSEEAEITYKAVLEFDSPVPASEALEPAMRQLEVNSRPV